VDNRGKYSDKLFVYYEESIDSNSEIENNSFLNDYFFNMKQLNVCKKVNTTSIGKFAVIKMMEQNIPEMIISHFTGLGDTIISDCIDHIEKNNEEVYLENFEYLDYYLEDVFVGTQTFINMK
jgi:hypothetical protein